MILYLIKLTILLTDVPYITSSNAYMNSSFNGYIFVSQFLVTLAVKNYLEDHKKLNTGQHIFSRVDSIPADAVAALSGTILTRVRLSHYKG